jgi:hypothetical protein
LSEDNILYFRQMVWRFGYFSVDLNSGTPINVGYPINSSKDDFAFTFNEDKM